MILLLAVRAVAASTSALTTLTAEERAWINANPVVRIGNPDLPPYHFTDRGKAAGYQVEMLDAMLQRLGLRAEYEQVPLATLLDGLKSGRFDVIMDPIYRKERDEFILFSDHSFDITLGIFARYGRKDIRDLASLRGKRIGSYRDYALEAKLRKLLPDAAVVQADDSEGMLRLVSTGKADFCVVELRSGEFILRKQQISNVATHGVFQAPGEVPARAHDYGVRRSAPVLADVLHKAVQAMDPAEKERIWKRWFSTAPDPGTLGIALTDEERDWLAAGHTVRARVADYPPYMISQPVPAGIAVDYLRAIAQRFGFKIEFLPARHGWVESLQDVAGTRQHYDLLPVMNRTPEREQQFALTKDILTSPLVIYIRNDSPLISNLDALAGKTVAAEKAFVVTERLRTEYPKIRLLEVSRASEALEAVATGRADAYIGNLTNASYVIQQQRLNNLMVAAPAPFGNYTQAVAVRKDWAVLAGLIDRGMASLPAEELSAIQSRWGAVQVAPRSDYTLVWQVLALATLILAAFLYWNRRLSAEIARRRLVEADLLQAKETAEMASRAKSTFLANMSHELRTPMNAIMGMNALAQRRATDPKQLDQLGKIDTASQHLLQVINDILDISKIEAERMTIEEVDFFLGDVLATLHTLIGPRAAEKGLSIRRDLPPGLETRVFRGDPLRLGQILLNLAGNAVKFTECGGIVLRCRIAAEDATTVTLHWEIEDSGIGIRPEDQPRLFTAFEQADGSMTRKYGGSGLGLAISKRLTRLMGGDIGVSSTPGQGSTFWFAVRLAPSLAVPPAPTLQASDLVPQRHTNAKVLLVEDEPVSCEVALILLDEVGITADVAEDGVIALFKAREIRYDLILMDMQLPSMNGVEATRAIRADSLNRDTPILAMTANAFEEDRQTCLAAGMNDHLTKPIVPDVLFSAVARWLAANRG